MRTLLVFVSVFTWAWSSFAGPTPDQQKSLGLEPGTVAFQSIDRLVFGDNHILFLADATAATIYAIALDEKAVKAKDKFEVRSLDEKLASLLGTKPEEIFVRDLAVHQPSQQAFLAVRRGSGDEASHHLFKVDAAGAMQPVSLKSVPHASYKLNNVPAPDATGRRGRKMRPSSISSMGFANKTLFVAGLSNEAFTSTVRQIPFPFNGVEKVGTTEIYHVAHERYETDAPVTSLVPWTWNNKSYLVAGYTCTPLVTFELAAFEGGKKVKGNTVAELGAGNSPVDIRSFEYDGKAYFLVANNRRSLMKINASDVMSQKGLTTPLDTFWDTKGVPFIALPGTPVTQLDVLNDQQLLVINRDGRGRLNLYNMSEKRILGIWD